MPDALPPKGDGSLLNTYIVSCFWGLSSEKIAAFDLVMKCLWSVKRVLERLGPESDKCRMNFTSFFSAEPEYEVL